MFLNHSPAPKAPKGRRRTLSLALTTALGLAALLIVLPAQGLGDQGPQTCTQNAQNGILCLTVSDTPDPVAYSGIGGNVTYLSFHAQLSNQSASSNLSHVGLSETLPADAPYFSATASRGSCSHSGQSVTCALGALAAGQTASVDVVVTAPATSDPNPPDETITNVVRASFDENFNDNPNNGGKQDSVAYPNVDTTVSATGTTFVPAGANGQINTNPDPTVHQHGKAVIDNPSTDVLATIDLSSPDNFCVNGQHKIGKKSYVCRAGGFVEVSVLNASDLTHYHSTTHPLVFHLQWDGSLSSSRQSKKNFVVFYQPDGSTSIQVISARCNAGATNLPCLRNISPLAAGGWSVDLVKPDNGRMR